MKKILKIIFSPFFKRFDILFNSISKLDQDFLKLSHQLTDLHIKNAELENQVVNLLSINNKLETKLFKTENDLITIKGNQGLFDKWIFKTENDLITIKGNQGLFDKWILKTHYAIYNLETSLDCIIEKDESIIFSALCFNEQENRKKIFQNILETVKIEIIIETGTWIGNTTGYLAQKSNLPIYTCEIDKRFYNISKMRLTDFSNIKQSLSDSREFLRSFLNSDILTKNTLFYLDAHWYEDLPLMEEIEIICNNWIDFIIIIDDFKVPNDDGYGFDDYEEGKSLSLETFSEIFLKYNLVPFFPLLPSHQETGKKRGCIILAKNGKLSEILENANLIRKHVIC
ncbi:MAG: hypothetical protein NTV31_04980 [Bacteroidia bacterium]|nr:hypothetical protein [Bacteroidia bacterium]